MNIRIHGQWVNKPFLSFTGLNIKTERQISLNHLIYQDAPTEPALLCAANQLWRTILPIHFSGRLAHKEHKIDINNIH